MDILIAIGVKAVSPLWELIAGRQNNSSMTFSIVRGVTAVAVVSTTAVFIHHLIWGRYIIVVNGRSHAISVTIEREHGTSESLIEAGESMKFDVSSYRPTQIRVKNTTGRANEAEVDYNYIKRGRQLLVI